LALGRGAKAKLDELSQSGGTAPDSLRFRPFACGCERLFRNSNRHSWIMPSCGPATPIFFLVYIY